MKQRKLLLTILAVLAISCTAEKKYDWDWVDDMTSPIPEEYDWFNDKWGLAATPVVSDQSYAFDGANSLETTIVRTSLEEGQKMLRYLDEVIFPIFPEFLIKETLPPTIYIVDSVNFTYVEEEYSSAGHKMADVNRALYGDIAAGHLTLAVSMLDGDPDEVKFNILSLVIERMMSNTTKWPVPQDFMAYGKTKIADLVMYDPYYQSSISARKTYFNLPGDDGATGFSFWSYCGSLRPCRYGCNSYCTFPEEDDLVLTFYVMTYMQDFADILSMLLLWTPEQIEAHLQYIDGKKFERESSVSGHIEYVIERAGMEGKMADVRKYMQENFKIQIL